MLNRIPFTADEFFGVFSAYNRAVWPMQVLLVSLAVVMVWLAARPTRGSERFIWFGLAALWLWSGIAYHVLHFSRINRMAYVFGALFMVQGILLMRMTGKERGFVFSRNASGVGGAILLLYALAIYPLIGILSGEHYPAMPTFGAPCPVALYTFGLLLWTRTAVPLHLLLIPMVWALIGSSAAAAFGVVQDLALPLAALVVLFARRHALQPHPRPAELRSTL